MSKSKLIRQQIWSRLHDVARPDTRFHLNFAEVIPDFEGSEAATERVVAAAGLPRRQVRLHHPRQLPRRPAAADDRGGHAVRDVDLWHLPRLPADGARDGAAAGAELYAAWLDGMEHFGRPITLAEIAARGRFDFLVTGASAVSIDGVRFGKGHGFFDLEWGMFTDLGLADETTPVVAVVHDCQVVEEALTPVETDILVDFIATPTRLHEVGRRARRPRGVKWPLLDPEQIASTPPLQELQRLQGLA